MRWALASTAAFLVLAAPAFAAPQPKVITPGVVAGGVAVGGLSVSEATAVLEQRLGKGLRSPVEVRVGRFATRLHMRELGLKFAADRTARRAYRAGVKGELVVAPFVTYRRAAVRAWVAQVGRRLFAAPRNARLRITVRRMIRRKGRNGSALVQWQLRRAINRAVVDPLRSRRVAGRRGRVRPAITHAGLARRNRTVVTIDRGGFRLRVFKRLRYDRSYPIAVGAAGFDTPSGLFRITNKRVNPAWTAPNRPWAGSYAGRTVPGGAPDNPLKARWLGVTGSVGIHGTSEDWSIGSRASHGCIRMHVSDVIDLYPRVPYGTPVLIR